MALKLILENIEGLDAAIAAEYTKSADGKYHLTTDVPVYTKDKVDEFRNKNIELLKELDKFKGFDIDKIKAEAQAEKEKELLAAGKIDEVVAQRITAMKAEYEVQLAEKDKTTQAVNTKLSELLIDNAIAQAATKHGVRSTALADVLLRGKQTFSVEAGKAVIKDGENIRFGKDGKTPVSVEEWLTSLTTDAPHLFEISTGGGGQGGKGNTNIQTELTNTQKIANGLKKLM